MQLGGAQHVARGVEGNAALAAPHGLAEAEHPPAAWPSSLGYQRQRLGGEQRFFVPARVVRVRVRDEGKRTHDEWVEPQPMPGQRYPMVPDDLASPSLTRSPWAKRRCGTAMPIASEASRGTPRSATRARPRGQARPG